MDNGNEDVVDTFYSEVLAFYSEVLAFYRTAVKDLNILPFNDCVLNNLKCLNTLLQGQSTLRTKTVNIVPYSFDTIGEHKLEHGCHAYDVLELSEHVKQCFELSDGVRVSMLVTVDQF